METSTIQSLLDKAFSDDSISFEISSAQHAMVISIPEGSDLIRTMDDLWLGGKELLIPLDKRGKVNPRQLSKSATNTLFLLHIVRSGSRTDIICITLSIHQKRELLQSRQ